MVPNYTPDKITGSIIKLIFISIQSPFPFFKGWGVFIYVKFLIVAALKILKFEKVTAFLKSKF